MILPGCGRGKQTFVQFGPSSGEAEGRDGWDMANEGEEMEEDGRGYRSSNKRGYFSFAV